MQLVFAFEQNVVNWAMERK